jgi:trehalose 6-phosphate phosphatase
MLSGSKNSLSRVRSKFPRPLLSNWPAISRLIKAAEGVALFLDFDGTLVDFQPRPDQVRLALRTRLVLRKLAAHKNVRVMIVSGRRRPSLLRFIKVPGLRLSGLYGWEHQEGLHLPDLIMRRISKARAMLTALKGECPGIYVEDKGISFAVHFRDLPRKIERKACTQLRKFLPRFRGHLRIIRAGNVWELAPQHIRGKGVAMRVLLQRLPDGFLPIYVGDDLTDEPAFKVVRDGISVIVGSRRPTSASFSLPNPAAVCKFLERLHQCLSALGRRSHD